MEKKKQSLPGRRERSIMFFHIKPLLLHNLRWNEDFEKLQNKFKENQKTIQALQQKIGVIQCKLEQMKKQRLKATEEMSYDINI